MCLSLFSAAIARDCDVLNDQKSIRLTVLKTWKSHSMVAVPGRSLLATPTHVGQKCLCTYVQRSWGRVREWGKGRDQTYPCIMKPSLHPPTLWVEDGIGLFLKVERPWLSHLSRSLCASPHGHVEGWFATHELGQHNQTRAGRTPCVVSFLGDRDWVSAACCFWPFPRTASFIGTWALEAESTTVLESIHCSGSFFFFL